MFMVQLTKEQELNIITFYIAPNSLRATSNEFNVTRFIIKKVLQKYNISLHNDSIISDIKKETYTNTSLKNMV